MTAGYRNNQINHSAEISETVVARAEAIVKTARDAIIIFSADDLRIAPPLNPAAEAIFGYEGAEIYGQPITILLESAGEMIPGSGPNSLNEALSAKIGPSTYREMVGRRADGSTFPMEFTLSETIVGHDSFYIGTFRDISLRKQAEAELERYRERLEEQVSERTVKLTSSNELLLKEIVQREQVDKALRESEERFRQVISSISHHVYMTELTDDGKQINRYISPNIEVLTGYPLKRFVDDWSFWPTRLIHPEDRTSAANQLRLFEQGRNSEVEYRLNQAGGETIWVRDSGRVERDPLTQSILVYGVVSNITLRKQTEEALARARDQALEASRLKSQLLAKVSHDLRTPLNAILGFAEMLDFGIYGTLSDDQHLAIAEIIDSTTYLTALVNELLDQAQLDAGKLKLNISTFAPIDLITAVNRKMAALPQAKGLTITTDLDPQLPAAVLGDPARIQQILVNLVSNAVKFTDQGSVSIRFYRADMGHWAVEVADTGPGIPSEAQTEIFEPFRQVDGSVTREHGGSGLGLSIVKQLTALMGGRVIVDSKLGQGSTFTVRLPLYPIQDKRL